MCLPPSNQQDSFFVFDTDKEFFLAHPYVSNHMKGRVGKNGTKEKKAKVKIQETKKRDERKKKKIIESE